MKFDNYGIPKIGATTKKHETFSGWQKCPQCEELLHIHELERNLSCCPRCDYHFRLSAEERIKLLCDENSFQELFETITSNDPLLFVDTEPYAKRLQAAQEKAKTNEAVRTGIASICGIKSALGVMDFAFMGGSMGSGVGEKITRLIELAEKEHLPLVIVSVSGGARMQESALSLMQMAKTSAALSRYATCKKPYISILTNPTTGGVTASFASLGDIIIAEPNSLVCFAGPRVIEQVLKKPLPKGAQQSEFLLHHGMIDCIVRRHALKNRLGNILRYTYGHS